MSTQSKQGEVPSETREFKRAVMDYVNEVPNFHSKEENSFNKEDLTPEGITRIL